MATKGKGKSQQDAKAPKTETKPKVSGAKRSKKEEAVKPDEVELPASPPAKDSRKRAADSLRGDDEAAKPPKPKAGKTSKKAKLSDDNVKPSKLDGHPIATAKTVPGGDMVEVEPPKPVRSRKGKGKNSEEAVASSSLQEEKDTNKGKRSKRSNGKAPEVESAPDVQDQVPNDAVPKASKPAKAKKGLKKNAVDETAVIPAEMDDAAIVPTKDTSKARKSKGESDSSSKTPEALAESKIKSRKRKAPEEVAEVEANQGNGLLDAVVEETKSLKKKMKRAKDGSNGVVDKIAQGVNAAVSAVGDVLGSANKSITDDVTEVAKGVVDVRADEKKEKKSKNVSKKGTEDVEQVEEEDESEGFQNFEDTAESATAIERNASEEDDSAEELEEDDQTVALLQGFESSGEEDASGDEGFKEGKSVPKLPQGKQISKQLKKIKAKEDDEPGVVYVGRIPHGFHEHEMRAYFSQFGTVNHVRLSRNKKTGSSKHYAFLEFASSEVARIAADTMDNYLMFGHILKCKVVPKEQVHPKLWAGADRRFKKVPWNKIEGRKLELPKGKEEWEKKNEVERKRREAKAEKLKAIGYEFAGPELRNPHDVPAKEKPVEAIEEPGASQDEILEKETVMISGGVEGNSVTVKEDIKIKKRGRKARILTEDKVEVKAGSDAVLEQEPADGITEVLGALDSVAEAVGERVDVVAQKAKRVVKEGDVAGGKKARKAKK